MRKKRYRLLLLLAFIFVCTASCGRQGGEAASADNGEAVTNVAVVTDAENNAEADAGIDPDVKEKSAEDGSDPESEAADENVPEETQKGEGDKMGEASKLLYQGHASVRITTPEGKTIFVDPFMGEGYDAPADLILITHDHYDHTQTKLIKTKNADCQTITWKEALKGGHQTFDLGYVRVEAVEAGYNRNHNVKKCVGYILTFSNGATLYLTGDTSTTPQMKELADRKLDYAFFCCDGVYNMDVQEAIECALSVGAKHSIPYHMVPANKDGFDQSVAESFDVPGRIIVKPGEELILE